MYSIASFVGGPRLVESCYFRLWSESQAVIYRDSDLLLGPQVTLCRLYGRVAQKKLNLLQVAAGLAAELRAGAAEVVGAEALDPDLPGCSGDDSPDCPISQTLPDLAGLVERAHQRPVSDFRGGLPGVDALLHPQGDGPRCGCVHPCQ